VLLVLIDGDGIAGRFTVLLTIVLVVVVVV
jgi:hypothetical protein